MIRTTRSLAFHQAWKVALATISTLTVLATLALPTAVVGAATDPSTSPSPAKLLAEPAPVPSSQKPWHSSTWMGDLFGTGHLAASGLPAPDVTLRQLAIPGTHDSGAYFTGHYVSECNGGNPGFAQQYLDSGVSEQWARTQHHDLFGQADLGARAFDIRPYWDGQSLGTCHARKTASLDDVFTNTTPGHTGLNKFVADHPKEVMLINISHFAAGSSDQPKYKYGVYKLGLFLRDNVCPHALTLSEAAYRNQGGSPGGVTLATMWKYGKNYVIIANESTSFFHQIVKWAPNCVFPGGSISGGYPGENTAVKLSDGKTSTTNYWRAMFDEAKCSLRLWNPCQFGNGEFDSAQTVREASEQVLINQIKEPRKALHETTYIWAYGDWAGVGNSELAALPFAFSRSSLIAATEDREMIIKHLFPLPALKVKAGLFPDAKNFIARLQTAALSNGKGLGVNIVSMDALGNGNGTNTEFIAPMMEINKGLLK
jgi:hypothetical protein